MGGLDIVSLFVWCCPLWSILFGIILVVDLVVLRHG